MNRLFRGASANFFCVVLAIFAAGFARGPALADTFKPSATHGAAANQTGLPMLKMMRELQAPGLVSGVTWSSDGTKVAAFSIGPGGAGIPGIVFVPNPYSSLITIWNIDGTVYRELRRDRPFIDSLETFSFADGNKQIATPPPMDSVGTAFTVFDLATGKLVHDISGSHPRGDRSINGAKHLVASADQSVLATSFGDSEPQPVALYSTKDWTKLGDLPDPPGKIGHSTGQLSFSRDGRFLAVTRGGSVALIYDLGARKVIQSISTFPDIYGGDLIAFSPDAAMIVVASTSGGGDPIRVFSAKNASLVDSYSAANPRVDTIDWSPDGRSIAFIADARVLHLWVPLQLHTTERVITFANDSLSLAFSPDGRALAVGVGRNVEIFDVTP